MVKVSAQSGPLRRHELHEAIDGGGTVPREASVLGCVEAPEVLAVEDEADAAGEDERGGVGDGVQAGGAP